MEDERLEYLRQNFVEQYSAIPPPEYLWKWIAENFTPKAIQMNADCGGEAELIEKGNGNGNK